MKFIVILYDDDSDVTHTPAWYITIIELNTKERWPDAYDTLEISDVDGKVSCVYNDHGIMVEKFV